MEKKKSLKANIVFSIITQFIIYISPLIVSPYVSRVLGPEGIGEYSHAYSYMYYFSSLICFGFSTYGIDIIAKHRDDKEQYAGYFWTIISERFAFFLIFVTAYLLILIFNRFGGLVNLSVGLSLALYLISNAIDITFLYQGLEEFKLVSVGNLISNIVYLAAVFLFVKKSEDVYLYTIIKSSITLITNLFLWPLSIKRLTKFKFLKSEAGNILKSSAKFFLPSLLMTVGPQIDQMFIGMNCTDTEVGYYQQATKVPQMISNLIYAISPVMLSRISYLYKNGKYEEAKQKISQSLCLALALCLPCAIGCYLIGRFLIPLYFGADFTPSVDIFYILLPTCLSSPLASILINAIYYPKDQMKKLSLFLIIAIAGNTLATFFLTKYTDLGARGAAFGTLGAAYILISLILIDCRHLIHWKWVAKDFLKILVGLTAMVAVGLPISIYVTIRPIYLILIEILACSITYFLLLFIMKEFILQSGIRSIKVKLQKRE